MYCRMLCILNICWSKNGILLNNVAVIGCLCVRERKSFFFFILFFQYHLLFTQEPQALHSWNIPSQIPWCGVSTMFRDGLDGPVESTTTGTTVGVSLTSLAKSCAAWARTTSGGARRRPGIASTISWKPGNSVSTQLSRNHVKRREHVLSVPDDDVTLTRA